jgi:hypothetical protein
MTSYSRQIGCKSSRTSAAAPSLTSSCAADYFKAMSELGGLERLESLHRDILALSQYRLSNVERLWVQLEAHIGEFRHLLEKKTRSEQSRKSLATGTATLNSIRAET